SCVTAGRYPEDSVGARELATRQWFACVRFRETILKLHESGVASFVEVGPGGKLTGFVRDILKGRRHTALATNIAGKSALLQFQMALGALFVGGADVDPAPLFAHRSVGEIKEAPAPARRPLTVALDTVMPVMTLDPAKAREIGGQLRAVIA